MFDFVPEVMRGGAFTFRSDDQDFMALDLAEFEEAKDGVGDAIYLGKKSFCDDSDSHDP